MTDWKSRLLGYERGSGSMLVVGCVLILMFSTWIAVWAIGWIGSVQLARSVADSAALSAARAKASGVDPCAEASKSAGFNQGRILSCQVFEESQSFRIRVVAQVVLRPQIGNVRYVSGEANAGIRDGTLDSVSND